MIGKAKIDGHDGAGPYVKGDMLIQDSEHLRTLLANGLADAKDDIAKAWLSVASNIERYAHAEYQALARSLGFKVPGAVNLKAPSADAAAVGVSEQASIVKTPATG